MDEMITPKWLPPPAWVAYAELAADVRYTRTHHLFKRLVTDPRLEPMYRRLGNIPLGMVVWRAFMLAVEDSAWVAAAAPSIKKHRANLPKQLQKVRAAAHHLAVALEELERLQPAAAVEVPLQLFFLPDLIEHAGRDLPRYRLYAAKHVERLARLGEAYLPSPARAVRSIVAIAHHSLITPLPVCGSEMLERPIASRRLIEQATFARAFDIRSTEYKGLAKVHLSHSELAALSNVALNVPASYAGFDAIEVAEMTRATIRQARRTGVPGSNGAGGGFSGKKASAKTLSPSTIPGRKTTSERIKT